MAARAPDAGLDPFPSMLARVIAVLLRRPKGARSWPDDLQTAKAVRWPCGRSVCFQKALPDGNAAIEISETPGARVQCTLPARPATIRAKSRR